MTKNIVFLVSAGGGNLRFLHNALQLLNANINISAIIADRETKLSNWAKKSGILYSQIEYKRTYNTELKDKLLNLNPHLIITNIHKIIDSEILELFENKFVNLHYSLLPAFAGEIGMSTILKAKSKQVGFIGGTAHLVTEEVDQGPVICQHCFSVFWEKENDENLQNIMFRASAMCLLNAVLIKLNCFYSKETTSEVKILNKTVNFSPSLRFNPKLFSFEFWEKIKNG